MLSSCVAPLESTRQKHLRNKLESTIIIPEIDIRTASILDVLMFLSESVWPYDSRPPQEEVVNIVFNPRGIEASNIPTVTYKAKGVSILQALKDVTQLAGLQYTIENNWVIVGKKYFSPEIRTAKGGADLERKVKSIIVPDIDFRFADIDNALAYLVEQNSVNNKNGNEVRIIDSSNDSDPTAEVLSDQDMDPFAEEVEPVFFAKDKNRLTCSAMYLSLYDALRLISQITSVEFEIQEKGIVMLGRDR
jgi:hypothetical protein